MSQQKRVYKLCPRPGKRNLTSVTAPPVSRSAPIEASDLVSDGLEFGSSPQRENPSGSIRLRRNLLSRSESDDDEDDELEIVPSNDNSTFKSSTLRVGGSSKVVRVRTEVEDSQAA